MVNGPHSGVAVLVLVAVMAVRMLASQRRRSGGRSTGARGFTAGPAQPGRRPGHPADGSPDAVADEGSSTGAALGGTAPGWFRDPFVRHEHRYWSGTAWTEHVQDRGVPGIDAPPPGRGPST